MPPKKTSVWTLSAHENTFERAKESRWRIIALGWNMEIRKDTLRMVGKINSPHLHHPSPKPRQPSMEKDILPMGEGDWNECSTSPQTSEPTHLSRRPTLSALGGSLQAPENPDLCSPQLLLAPMAPGGFQGTSLWQDSTNLSLCPPGCRLTLAAWGGSRVAKLLADTCKSKLLAHPSNSKLPQTQVAPVATGFQSTPLNPGF